MIKKLVWYCRFFIRVVLLAPPRVFEMEINFGFAVASHSNWD